MGDFVDDDMQVGHGIGYPFYQPDRPESLNNPALIHPPNRLRWVRYMPSENINDVTTFFFSRWCPRRLQRQRGGHPRAYPARRYNPPGDLRVQRFLVRRRPGPDGSADVAPEPRRS